jgi:ATP-binding cassette subfamily F protein uup
MAHLMINSGMLTLGGKPLFVGVDISVDKGQKGCLVGRNGTGKSTLLKVLAGELELDGGEFFTHPRCRITYLPQVPSFEGFETVMDYVCEKAPEYLAQNYLDQLGLDPKLPLKTLSGGECRKATLVKLFVEESDVLLLDEPTNHLDIKTIEWLENEIRMFRGAILVISHDRQFLENVTNCTFWLERGTLRTSTKGFKAFEEWSEEIMRQEEVMLGKMDKLLQAETHWLARGVTARRKRNQGRLRNLMDLRQKRREVTSAIKTASLTLKTGGVSGHLVIEAHKISKSFEDRMIFEDLSLKLARGDRMGLVGPNGVGKSTLLNILLKKMPADSGSVRHGTQLQVAHFAQSATNLPNHLKVRDYLCDAGGDHLMVHDKSMHVVAYLKEFLFDERQALSPISALSGGERNRLVLAKIFSTPCNLLVLDEPTNDLDMETLDLLVDLISNFEGTILIVSHDRHFLDETVGSVLVFEQGKVQEYVGGYTDYLNAKKDAEKPVSTVKKDLPLPPKESKKFGFKEKFRYEQLEKEITENLGMRQKLEKILEDGSLYEKDPNTFNNTSHLLQEAIQKLGLLEEEWLALEILRDL